MRRVDISRAVTESNDVIAARNRERFAEAGVLVLNIIGSPGCGKTSVLEYTARHLEARFAAIIGDVRTALDAERVDRSGMEAHAVETGGGCHLNAAQIASAIESIRLAELDFLFIENVGNLVCPSVFDLGEDAKVAMLSVPEGDEKIRKYPALFVRADVVLVNKTDLLEHLEYDLEGVVGDAEKARPGVRAFGVSARDGAGFEQWFDYLRSARAAKAGG